MKLYSSSAVVIFLLIGVETLQDTTYVQIHDFGKYKTLNECLKELKITETVCKEEITLYCQKAFSYKYTSR